MIMMVINIDTEYWFTPSPLCSDFSLWFYLAGSVAISCNQLTLVLHTLIVRLPLQSRAGGAVPPNMLKNTAQAGGTNVR